ncbi:MAG: hypothetical protein AB4911_08055 [Oscillochloridaceae bacterium umkhey_bin13]
MPDEPQRVAVPRRSWWHTHGEPWAVTGLAMVAISLLPLWALGLITPDQAGRLAIILVWLAALLGLLRLPQYLGRPGHRMGLLALIMLLGIAMAAMVALPPAAEAQSAGLTFKSAPRISRAAFSQILANGRSPAAPYGDELYTIIVGYGLDPAVALAFFQHESQYCTTGACARGGLQNWGMLRRHIRPERNAGTGEGFARYATWQDGVRDWCELMLGYVNRGMDTVEKAIPVYAPRSDGNVPTSYIAAIRRQVAAWSGRTVSSAGPTLRAYDDPLEMALLRETFVTAEVEFRPEWAFHQFLLAEAARGRPLGTPVDESRVIMVGGQRFAVQVFALDTLYTPLSNDPEGTNWSDVRRLSNLLRTPPSAPAGR